MPPKIDCVLVDDDPEWIELIVRALNRPALSATTHCFTDPESALQYLQHHEAGIVITDLRMPQLDGFAFTRAVRSISATVPVVIVSSIVISQDEVSACGANAYVNKRMLNTDLAPAVAALLPPDMSGGATADACVAPPVLS